MSSRQIELSVGGMTCASCSRRVEKALGKIDGVSALVNYATGVALVDATTDVSNDALVAAVEKSGYSAVIAGKAKERFGRKEFRIRLIVCAILTIPIMAISMIADFQFMGWQYFVAAMTLPVAMWGAWPFHRSAFVNLRHAQVTMDTLVSLGVVVSGLWSLWALFFTSAGDMGMVMHPSLLPRQADSHEPGMYFEIAAAVTTLVLLGKFLEHRAREQSLVALESLATLNPKFATIVEHDKTRVIPIENVRVGDTLFVATGEQVPVDGHVLDGQGHVDKSLVTGESLPLLVSVGESVIGATVLLDGTLTIRATAVGKDTVISAISRLVHQAQTGKAEVTRLVDRVAEIFVPLVVVLALATALGWFLRTHDVQLAMTIGISVLVIACPCALGLATPTALLVGTGRGAQLGILIRGPHALEASRSLDTIYLDKTGTLTIGRMVVSEYESLIPDSQLWPIVDSLEQAAQHPAAQSLREFAASLGYTGVIAQRVVTVAGSGIQGIVNGHPCTIGSVKWLGAPAGPLRIAADTFAARGDSVVMVYEDARAVATIALADSIHPSSKSAVAELQRMKIEPVIMSGDHQAAVEHVAGQLGISRVFANCMPNQKLDILSAAQAEGHIVAMVGDGVNDAAALAKAHLSLAMGSGTDVAANSADIVLMRSTMSAAVDALRLSRATMRTIQTNLFWAFGYNVAAIPLAMMGYLGPIIASGAMAFSSVFVVTNSLRLRRFKPLS